MRTFLLFLYSISKKPAPCKVSPCKESGLLNIYAAQAIDCNAANGCKSAQAHVFKKIKPYKIFAVCKAEAPTPLKLHGLSVLFYLFFKAVENRFYAIRDVEIPLVREAAQKHFAALQKSDVGKTYIRGISFVSVIVIAIESFERKQIFF